MCGVTSSYGYDSMTTGLLVVGLQLFLQARTPVVGAFAGLPIRSSGTCMYQHDEPDDS